MKITNVEVIIFHSSRNFATVKIETDQDGLYGLGDVTLNGREQSVLVIIEEYLKPMLIGQDPQNTEYLWEYLYLSSYWRAGPVLMTAISGIDMALWDIKGKIVNKPLHWLLGGKVRNSVSVYSHVAGKTLNDLLKNLEKSVESGFDHIRFQFGLDDFGLKNTYGTGGVSWSELEIEEWDSDIYIKAFKQNLPLIKKHIPEHIKLLHDSHERLSINEALALAPIIDEYQLFFWEDPFRPENIENKLSLLKQHLKSPIAFGELLNTKWQATEILQKNLIDFIRTDIGHCGGITEAKRIATLASVFDVKTAWHGPPDMSPIGHSANTHLSYAVSNFGIQEWCPVNDTLTNEIITGLPEVKNGNVYVSDKPGLGCDINIELAKKHPYKRGFLPIARKLDGHPQAW